MSMYVHMYRTLFVHVLYVSHYIDYIVPKIQSECRPWQYFHSMTHHGHFMQCRLTIEYNQVIINQVTFHLHSLEYTTITQGLLHLLLTLYPY